MTTPRTAIKDFQLANPIYRNASVYFYTVSAGVKTTTLANLYSGTSGLTQLANPQKLSSSGKFKQAVYIDVEVIATVVGISTPSHDTGIITPSPSFRVNTITGYLEYSFDGGTSWNSTGTPAGAFAPVTDVQNGQYAWCGTAGGTANALTLTAAPAVTAHVVGQVFRFKSGATGNTGAATASVSGLTAGAIQNNGAALAEYDISASKWYELIVSAISPTVFQLNKLERAGIHLSIYTVAPNQASNADKQRADFVCDGVNDQVTILAALTAAGSTNSKVVCLPGAYELDDTLAFPDPTSNLIFDAEGAQFNCNHATHDGVDIFGSVRSTFRFGTIFTNGSGAALSCSPAANGASFNNVSWSELRGTARTGIGLKIHCSNAGLSVCQFTGGPISQFDKGISVVSTNAVYMDTLRISVNYLHDCNKSIYVHSDTPGEINTNFWTINFEASSSGDIGMQTNACFDVILGAVLGVAGGTVVQLDSGANHNQFNITPPESSFTTTYITDNSGKLTNTFNGKRPSVITAISTAGDGVLTAAGMVGGFIRRTGPVGAYADTTDTATNIIAAIPNVRIGSSFEFIVINTVAQINTVAAGAGVTLANTTTIAASRTRRYLGVVTNVSTPAITITGIGEGTL